MGNISNASKDRKFKIHLFCWHHLKRLIYAAKTIRFIDLDIIGKNIRKHTKRMYNILIVQTMSFLLVLYNITQRRQAFVPYVTVTEV